MQQKEAPNNSTRYDNNILHVLLKTSNIKNITTIIHARITNKIVSGQDAIIVGSVRRDRQVINVARWMEGQLKNRNHTVYFIDPLEQSFFA